MEINTAKAHAVNVAQTPSSMSTGRAHFNGTPSRHNATTGHATVRSSPKDTYYTGGPDYREGTIEYTPTHARDTIHESSGYGGAPFVGSSYFQSANSRNPLRSFQTQQRLNDSNIIKARYVLDLLLSLHIDFFDGRQYQDA